MKKKMSIGIASLMTAQVAFAQYEDFPPPPPAAEFGTEDSSGGFPPPAVDNFGSPDAAPSAGAGTPSRSGGNGSSGRSGLNSNGKKEVLTREAKNKFNKAGPEDITNENFPETIESFDFPNVEITDIIKAIGELTGKNFIIDPGVRGKITIIAPSKITVAEAYKAFLSALAINGFTVVPSGSFLKIKSARNAQRDSIETYSGSYYPNSDQMITRIIHLKHISAEQVNRDLRILPSKDGEMSIYPPTNSIILSDYGSNIDRVMKIISQLDVPGFEEQLEVIPVKFAKSKDLADLVDKIVNKGQKGGSGGASIGNNFTAGVPRFSRGGSGGATSQQGASFFMAIPDDRTNSIIVVGNKSGILRVKKLVAQLDFRISAADNGGVYVYYVKNGDAEKIAQTLTGVTKDASPKPTSGGSLLSPMGAGGQMSAPPELFGGDVKITADKNTNSLVIVASKQDYEVVANLLAKIDIARDQVFVEAIIMEMNASDTNDWGVGYYKYGPNGYGKVGFNGGVKVTDILSPTSGSGAVISFANGSTVNVTDPSSGKSLAIPSLIGLINFIKQVKKGNILSTPQIMAMDNQEAEIEVGDKVATSVTRTAGTATTQESITPNFEDATIKLNIKPFISPSSETVRMEIKQNVKQLSNVAAPKALEDSTRSLATRSIKTTIVVRNGDTAIMGGLIKDQETETVTKVPLLGDIPILGWLFKSKNTTKEKVNMVMFLTPKIIRNPSDNRNIIAKKLEDRLDFIKSQGGRDPYGKTIDDVVKNNGAAVNKTE